MGSGGGISATFSSGLTGRPDRLVPEETLDILGQLSVAVRCGILPKVFEANGLQIPRHVGLDGHDTDSP